MDIKSLFPPFNPNTLYVKQEFVMIQEGGQPLGSILAVLPIGPDGNPDFSRPPSFGGQINVLVTHADGRQMNLPLTFHIEGAVTIDDACVKFPAAGTKALETFQQENFRRSILNPGKVS
jgi:hypothetical protein